MNFNAGSTDRKPGSSILTHPNLTCHTPMTDPIEPEDVVEDADRNYDLGRKHGHGEKADLLDWAETLLCNSLPMSHCSQEEWDRLIKAWRDEKHGVSAPNAPDQRTGQ